MGHPSARQMGTRRARAAVCAPLVLALLTGAATLGCGQDRAAPAGAGGTARPEPPPATDTVPETTRLAPATGAPGPTAAMSTDEAEVRATIDRYWDAWFAAVADPPDPDNPEINAVLTGLAHDRIIGSIQKLKADGQFIRKPANSVFKREIRSVTFDARGIATVNQCVVDDTQLVNSSSETVLDGGLTTSEFSSTLRQYDGSWRITTSTETSKLPGRAGCAA